MKKIMIAALTLGTTVSANMAMAADITPEQSRQQFVDYFKAKSPSIEFNEYVMAFITTIQTKECNGRQLKNFHPI